MQKNSFKQLPVPLSARIENANESYLYFGGTAYLGIPQNKEFIKRYVQGIDLFGLNNGTSRNNNIQLNIYNEAEQFAAEKYGADAALISSSGYLAAQLTVKELSTLGQLRYAPATHPALWLNDAPDVKGSFNDWAKNLVAEIKDSQEKSWVIVSNSMNNLYPEVYDFSIFGTIAADKNVILIVDDSHGIGINNNGLGAYSSLPKANHIDAVVVASMAKALGVDAGLVLGSTKTIARLKQTSTFLGASPPAAAGLFAFMHANPIYQVQLEKLLKLSSEFATALKNESTWSFISDFPVFLARKAEINTQLLQDRILISSFPYPDKDGNLINRIVLSSWHNSNDLRQLIRSLKK